ncbi:MAG: fimbrial biogenesis outer membrane usher protein [Gammaproteobacteria bacterium]|nr:fimbrial biogenesis outer membrane usher protein [Gammaproteobacteria bacterium]
MPRCSLEARLLLAFCGLLCCRHAGAAGAAAAWAEDTGAPGAAQQIERAGLHQELVAVTLNGQPVDAGTTALRDAQGGWRLRATDLTRWRVRAPATGRPQRFDGVEYWPLSALPGVQASFEAATQTLHLQVAADALVGSVVDGRDMAPPNVVRPSLGGFVNYDALWQHSAGLDAGTALLETGAFNRFGVLTSDTLVAESEQRQAAPLRLTTTFTRDLPSQLASLRLGDSISDGGAFGRSVRFGGFQYATNFDVQPNLVTFPLPTVAGSAGLPSTVDLYVNDTLVERKGIQPGPFRIPQVPVVTGNGQVRVVVTDLLGRQQVITQSFYASAELLRPGLDQFSFETGAQRKDFGVDSNRYGRGFAAATWRRGLNEQFTGELHAEAAAGQQPLGLSGALLVPWGGVVTASTAGSQTHGRVGGLWDIGYQRQGDVANIGLDTRYASRDFTELGTVDGQPLPRWQTTASVGAFVGRFGSVGLAYIDRDDRLLGRTSLVSQSYSVELGRWGFLGFNASEALDGSGSNSFLLSLTRSFGARTSASVSLQRQDSGSGAQASSTDLAAATLQRNLPTGPGWGYRVTGSSGQDALNAGEVSLNTESGTYRAGVSRSFGTTGYEAEASGSLGLVGGHLLAARKIPDSFALVQVPGYANVRIYEDNQLVARTDAGGNALLTNLRPFEDNPIRIDPNDLPLNAQVNALQLDAVPFSRSGVVLKFPIQRSRAATVTLTDEAGHPLPPGAQVQIGGTVARYPVGLDGLVYLAGLQANNRLQARWDGHRCTLELNYPSANKDPLPDLGRRVCRRQAAASEPPARPAGGR